LEIAYDEGNTAESNLPCNGVSWAFMQALESRFGVAEDKYRAVVMELKNA